MATSFRETVKNDFRTRNRRVRSSCPVRACPHLCPKFLSCPGPHLCPKFLSCLGPHFKMALCLCESASVSEALVLSGSGSSSNRAKYILLYSFLTGLYNFFKRSVCATTVTKLFQNSIITAQGCPNHVPKLSPKVPPTNNKHNLCAPLKII